MLRIELKRKNNIGVCNGAFEEELVKQLQKIWDNRCNLNHSDLRQLKRLGELFHNK